MEGTRKQNKIEKSENTQHKLSHDVFTLQMQATTADKPGWTLARWLWGRLHKGVETTSATRHTVLYKVVRHSEESSPTGFPLWSETLSLSKGSLTHIKSSFFFPSHFSVGSLVFK